MDQGESDIHLFKDSASRRKLVRQAPLGYRRTVGWILGLALGAAYALGAYGIQFQHLIPLPGRPSPFGVPGNIAVALICFTLVGWICALPEDEYRGAFFGTAATILLLEARALAFGLPGLLRQFATPQVGFAVVSLILESGIALGMNMAFRWAIDILSESFGRNLLSWARLRLPLGLAVGAFLLGIWSGDF